MDGMELLLFCEAVFPGSVLGEVQCECEGCCLQYTCEYNDDEEYPCPRCGGTNEPLQQYRYREIDSNKILLV